MVEYLWSKIGGGRKLVIYATMYNSRTELLQAISYTSPITETTFSTCCRMLSTYLVTTDVEQSRFFFFLKSTTKVKAGLVDVHIFFQLISQILIADTNT